MIESKAAIVTGAGSGVGRQTAVLLARSGYHVVLAARRRKTLEETAKLAAAGSDYGLESVVIPTDVCKQADCHALVNQTVARFGRIDALANIAGYVAVASLDKATEKQWQQTVATNLGSVIYLTGAAWPVFKRQGSGVVVNISSMASIDPFPNFSMYAATKAGLNMFTHCTGQEGEAIGVRAVGIAPGAIETPMLRRQFDEKIIPQDKTLSPLQVATLICDCIAGARDFKNGQTISLPSP